MFPGPYQKVYKAYSQATYSHVKIKCKKIKTRKGSTLDMGLFNISHEFI